MNNQMAVKSVDHTDNSNRIMSLLETLRQKVKNFTVLDKQSQRLGEVTNLILDANRQLNLVVYETTPIVDGQRVLLLPSKLIKKIDTSARSVYMDIDKLEIESNPEYLGKQEVEDGKMPDSYNGQMINAATEQTANSIDVVEEDIIRLLGERIIVDSTKRKVGEVIVRKQIETIMVQVPVRREKLIIEQVSPEHKQLAEVDLGQSEILGFDLPEGERQFANFDSGLTVNGEFSSPKIASLVLNAIALERNHSCKKVRVSILVEDESHQKTYQEWFDRCSKDPEAKPEKE